MVFVGAIMVQEPLQFAPSIVKSPTPGYVMVVRGLKGLYAYLNNEQMYGERFGLVSVFVCYS